MCSWRNIVGRHLLRNNEAVIETTPIGYEISNNQWKLYLWPPNLVQQVLQINLSNEVLDNQTTNRAVAKKQGCPGNEVRKRGIHLGFEIPGRHRTNMGINRHRPNMGIKVTPAKKLKRKRCPDSPKTHFRF